MKIDIYQRIMLKLNCSKYKSDNWEEIDTILDIVKKLKFTEEEAEEAELSENGFEWKNNSIYDIDLSYNEIKLMFNNIFNIYNNKQGDIVILILLYNELFLKDGLSKTTKSLNITNVSAFEQCKSVLTSLIEKETPDDVLKTIAKFIVETNVINKKFLDEKEIKYEEIDENQLKISEDQEINFDFEINKETFKSLKSALKVLKLNIDAYQLFKLVFPSLFE